MRIGFVHGVAGDPARLQAALSRLEGCDRIVSLGGWLGEAPPDPSLLGLLSEGGEGFHFLKGEAERRWARDRRLPEEARLALRHLATVAVEGGAAVVALGGGRRGGPARPSRLVAPLAVYAHAGPSRIWRQAGGLVRIATVRGHSLRKIGSGHLRLDLGPSLGADHPGVAILDEEAGTLEVFGGGAPMRRAGNTKGRAPIRAPEQIRLAI